MLTKRHLPSLAALQCFEAVARHLSFTRAAEELALTQSAVSKQVAQLEDQLEHLLFRRIRRRLQLTPAGALYVDEVRKILAQVEMSTHYLRAYGGDTEVLRIAMPSTFGARWLIPRTVGWRLHHPDIHLDLRSETEPDALALGRCDLALYFGTGTLPGAECLRLFSEEVVAVCSPSLMANGTEPDPMQLGDRVLLQLASRPEAWNEWFSSLGRHHPHSAYGPRFDTIYMCIRAAQAGCGLALLPRFLIEEELAQGSLVRVGSHAQASRNAYYLAYPEHAAEVPKVRAFVEWIQARLD